MRAFVRFRLPDGSLCELGHGDLIGRLWTAALQLDDPRISEAHAMVSLRGQSLKLLALRGRLALAHEPVSEVELEPAMRVWLSKEHELVVEAVELPAEVLAIEGEGLPRQVLTGVCSLMTQPRPALVPRAKGEASAYIWSLGAEWRIRIGDAPPKALQAGDEWQVEGRSFKAVAVAIDKAGQGVTQVKGAVTTPLRVVARFDTVHIHPRGEPVLVISGLGARMISELAACGVPVSWDVLAAEVWPDEDDRRQLRRKFDVSLARLRAKLREARIRPDLIRADGTGNLELVLYSQDEVLDET